MKVNEGRLKNEGFDRNGDKGKTRVRTMKRRHINEDER
jgi:hypothetical protein